MRQFLFVTAAFLSIELGGNGSLSAAASSSVIETPTQSPSDSATNSSSQTTSPKSKSTDEQDDQSQMAAWMIESSQVAKDYVDGLDHEKYLESWAKGDQLFQHTITKEEWAKALNDSRKPLGKVNSRKLKDQRPAKDPQG